MHIKNIISFIVLSGFLFIILIGCNNKMATAVTGNHIQPYALNPAYWQYRNKPVLLLGGSSNDNIFQSDSSALIKELNILQSAGGNYLRCTMSARDSGNVYPFYYDSSARMYDLNRWEEEYWRRFDYFLSATQSREIFVQIEIWATYDFYTRHSTRWADGSSPWDRNPFNPARNINYSAVNTGLPEVFESHGVSLINPFFATVLPRFDSVPVVLGFQQKFVDKLLSISLKYDHVLYCMDNETNAEPEWSSYWAEYVKQKSGEQHVQVEVTEMWDTYDPTDGEVKEADIQSPSTNLFTKRSGVSNTLYHPETYSFIDISNHNAQLGETHYKTGYYVWKKVQESGKIRPVNNVKIYGAGPSGEWNGSTKEGLGRFWRNIFAGSAAVRFHRQSAGLGNSDLALANIKSMRMLTDSTDIFSFIPDNELLKDRSDNEAYCLKSDNGSLLIYFPAEGSVNADIKSGNYQLSWLHIGTSAWQQPVELSLPGNIKTPSDDQWAVLIQPL